MKDVIEVIYGRKVHENWGILPFLGRIGDRYRYPFGVVPVPLMQWQNGTGTTQSGTVPPSRTGSVPIPNRVVQVPLVPTAPVFGIFAYFS